MIDEMERSVLYWITARYRANPPELAADEMASRSLRAAVRDLVRLWNRRFNRMSDQLARYFATTSARRSDTALKKILKDSGFSVDFKMTAAQRDVLGAIVHENVALIRSIPQETLAKVEGHVMRSVASGRDLGTLTGVLREQFGVARRRAELISKDQNNKATAALTRARYIETGITEAYWVHSSAGREPRKSHVAAGRQRAKFDISKGWWDPDEKKYILPGELINCRCSMRPVIRGVVA